MFFTETNLWSSTFARYILRILRQKVRITRCKWKRKSELWQTCKSGKKKSPNCEIKNCNYLFFFFFVAGNKLPYFCHKSGCWKPCADPCRPITLRSFLIVVSSRGVWDPQLLTVLCSMRSQVKNRGTDDIDHQQMPVTQVKPNGL